VGSPGFDVVVRGIARRAQPQAVVVSDTERDGDGSPTVTVSQRGYLVAGLEVETGGPDVHPGRLGGAVVDPSLVLAEALLTLRDELLPSLGTHPAHPVGVRTRSRTDAVVARTAGGRAMTGPGLDERITRRGALSVTQLASGGLGGAVPARSAARLDLRLPPRVDPADTSAALFSALAHPTRSDHVSTRLQGDHQEGSQPLRARAPLARIHAER
jgi:succinyl-diaminopimelate desuccinylase